jgi:hypothetical protein
MFGRIFAGITGIITKVVIGDVLAAQVRLKKVAENQTKLVKKGLKSTTSKKHTEGGSDENKENETNKAKNPTSSIKDKKRNCIDSDEQSDDDDGIEEIKSQYHHNAKRGRVAVVTPIST